jgi:hypothetical protein
MAGLRSHRNTIIGIVASFGGSNVRVFGSVERGDNRSETCSEVPKRRPLTALGGQVNSCGCYVASWRSRSAIVSTVGWPAATSITRS